MPETSIVVRAYNEEKYIGKLLEAIRAQRYQDFELIVVDSGSVDLTRTIAHQYCDDVLQIASRDFTFGYSLNVGCRQSSGKYIAIVSAHTLPCDDSWLERLVAPLRSQNLAMVYGRQRGTAANKYSESRDLERTFGAKPLSTRRPNYFANNANSAVRRDLWEQHPFDEGLPGLEDVEWARYWIESGYEVQYVPEAAIYHIHDETWRQVQHRYYREAVAERRMGIKHRWGIPKELLTQAKHLVADLWWAGREGQLFSKTEEVLRYRINKGLGVTAGIWNGSALSDPAMREQDFFDRTTQAVVIHGPGRASLKEVTLPRLKPGEVLIKVAYVGLCATDLEVLDGSLGYYKSGLAKYPIVPGHEFCGQVTELGPNVTELGVGDLVVAETVQGCGDCQHCRQGNRAACDQRAEVGVFGRDGAYAGYVVMPGRYAHKLPATVDLRSAVLCEPMSVVLKGLRRLDPTLNAPKRCAVVGAGPIGHICARILAHRGHQVTVFDRNPARLTLFDDVRVETQVALEQLSSFDVVIEATGDASTLESILTESAPGASVLLLGLPYARKEFDFENLVASDKALVGSVGAGPDDLDEAIDLLGSLSLHHLLQKAYALKDFNDAWKDLRAQSFLKVVLEVDPLIGQTTGGPATEAAMIEGAT